MRGFLSPAIKMSPNESQAAFAALSRARRSKLAKVANTTLLKADQWARGAVVTGDIKEALEAAFKGLFAKKKK